MIAEDCTSLPRALSEIFSNYQIQGKRKHFCMDLPHSDIAEGFFFFSFILSCSIQKASWHFSCLFFFFFHGCIRKSTGRRSTCFLATHSANQNMINWLNYHSRSYSFPSLLSSSLLPHSFLVNNKY